MMGKLTVLCTLAVAFNVSQGAAQTSSASLGQPSDQRQFEVNVSDALEKVVALRKTIEQGGLTQLQRDAREAEIKVIFRRQTTPPESFLGWSCILLDAKRTLGVPRGLEARSYSPEWFTAECQSGIMKYRLHFNALESRSKALIDQNKGDRIIFSGTRVDSEAHAAAVVTVFATLGASK